ncbi:hypothetical protein C0993_006088 [Termitomyces sp. T159_Od127]|nr:hypothetical protein C0993_006088 [Termitomyces sp. T159_Od127]
MALSGIKVVEFGGLAPGPFAGLILADNGATVIRVDKPDSTNIDVLHRGKRSIAINPKVPSGREALLKLISSADVVIDPFRPGVLERLGLGPEVFLGNADHQGLNPRLIYGRVVGFPRTGPHKDMADGQYMSVGCIEPQFFNVFVTKFLEALPKGFHLHGWRPSPQTRTNRDDWAKLKDFMVNGFKTNTRDYWAAAFHGTDACALPVLTPEEARATTSPDESFPAAHPRILGSQPVQPVKQSPATHYLLPGQHTQEILLELGFGDEEVRKLATDGALGKGARSIGSGHKL